jgi:hypothetical protein
LAGGYLVFFYRFGEFYTRFAGGRGFFFIIGLFAFAHSRRGREKMWGGEVEDG